MTTLCNELSVVSLDVQLSPFFIVPWNEVLPVDGGNLSPWNEVTEVAGGVISPWSAVAEINGGDIGYYEPDLENPVILGVIDSNINLSLGISELNLKEI